MKDSLGQNKKVKVMTNERETFLELKQKAGPLQMCRQPSSPLLTTVHVAGSHLFERPS